MAKEQTLQQIIEQIHADAEKLSDYIQEHQDTTTLFMLMNYVDEQAEETILSALLGNYKQTVTTLVATMEKHPDIAKFILHAVALFMSTSNPFGKVIKIPVDSTIGLLIQKMMEKQTGECQCDNCIAEREQWQQRKDLN